MFIRLKKSKTSKNPTFQIVKGVREGKRVRQKVVASLGVIQNESDMKKLQGLAESLIRRLEQQGLDSEVVNFSKLLHKKTEYNGFRLVTERLMDLVGFSAIAREAQGKNRFNVEEILKLIILQRMDLPSSKLRTYQRQGDHGFHGVKLEHVYRTMDALENFSEDFQKQAFEVAHNGLFKEPVDCLFFDVTTLYFESIEVDELRKFGFSKDQKHHQVQIVFSLIVNRSGIPLAYEAFAGNVGEVKTLLPVLEKFRKRFSVTKATVVCDRAMASTKNVAALQEAGFFFVLACKLRQLPEQLHINDLSLFKKLNETDKDEEATFVRVMDHPKYPDSTLIITYNSQRAAKDRKDRERLLEKMMSKLSSPEGSIKKLISNAAYKKFTTVKKGAAIALNQQAVDTDIAWDGFHGISISNGANLSVREALSRYSDLWHVEETFRVTKTTLKTRPIFHWVPHRILSHIMICFITLFLERTLESLLCKNGTPQTPDRIRYALSQMHSIIVEEKGSGRIGQIESELSEDAKAICNVLKIPMQRGATLKPTCCA
jgi:transposase